MLKKVLIHFGPPKTGTSAIQRWLQNNRKVLKEQGFFYPPHSVDSNGVSSGNVLAIYDRLEDRTLSLNQQKIDALLEQFNSSSAHTLLLSSEFFFQRLSELSTVLPKSAFIGYVRSPIELIDSSYNQSVKRHGNAKKIHLRPSVNARPLSFLKEFAVTINRSRLQLRSYLPSSFPQGDILADFLPTIGVEGYQSKQAVVVNPSYSLEALEAKRWFNGFDLGVLGHKLDNIMQRYPGELLEYSFIPPEKFEKFRWQTISVLREFRKAVPFHQANMLINYVQNMQQPPYIEQQINFEQFSKIMSYMRGEDAVLFKALCQHVHANSHCKNYQDVFIKALPKESLFQGGIAKLFWFAKSKVKSLLFSRKVKQPSSENVAAGNNPDFKDSD